MATIITAGILNGLFVAYRKEYREGLAAQDSFYQQIATTIPSNTSSNTYDWLGDAPDMREWVGERVIKSMAAHGYSIANKDWESSIGVKRPMIEDDQAGVYSARFKMMGQAAGRHPDQLVFGLAKKGHERKCYDGQNFFDPEHPVYQNHDGTGDPTMVSNIQVGSETGQPWMLIDNSQAIKPFIFQERKKPVFTSMQNLDDENVFMKNEFRFGVDSRSNVGFGFWQTAFMSTKPLNAENFNAAIVSMQLMQKDGGNPLGINPTHLVVSPHHREEALEIVKAERNAAGATNINRNAVDVISTAWMAQPQVTAA